MSGSTVREPPRGERSGRRAPRLGTAGVIVWWAALLLGPLLRPGLDVLTTHPETYARGEWGFLMRAGYLGVAVAGAVAALDARRIPVPAALLGLFAVGALTLGILPPTAPTGGTGLADTLFPYLQLTPLAFFPAAVWISWRSRRRDLRAAIVLAVVLFVPLVIGEPPGGGLLNRVADAAMGAWFAVYLRTSPGRAVE